MEQFFLIIANNKYFVYNFCNRPLNRFDQHCREWYFHNLKKNTEIEYNNKFSYDIYLEEVHFGGIE